MIDYVLLQHREKEIENIKYNQCLLYWNHSNHALRAQGVCVLHRVSLSR